MLNHSFVLDALESTAADTFHHFEELIDEHRSRQNDSEAPPSRLKQLVPTVNTFHTRLPLRKAFVAYNKKYALTKRKHITISFNELRHILNLAQIMAMRRGDNALNDNEEDEEELNSTLKDWEKSPGVLKGMIPAVDDDDDGLPPDLDLGAPATAQLRSNGQTSSSLKSFHSTSSSSTSVFLPSFKGPKMITFDGDQTLYSDGSNFGSNPELANYLYILLRHGVTIAVVTAAGYEYATEKYELRLSGLLAYFKERNLPSSACERFYLFGGECNYLMALGDDYKLHAVKEYGPGGWMTATKFIEEAPGNWDEDEVNLLLDVAEESVQDSVSTLRLRGRVIRKRRSVGLVPTSKQSIPREALDESVLTAKEKLHGHTDINLPFCAFNGGSDVWVDVGNKRVGVHILAAYLGMPKEETLHIGDQFLNTGNDFAGMIYTKMKENVFENMKFRRNDEIHELTHFSFPLFSPSSMYVARDICPCVWITSPDETTYILKSILRLAGVSLDQGYRDDDSNDASDGTSEGDSSDGNKKPQVNLHTVSSRNALMDVYTGEMLSDT